MYYSRTWLGLVISVNSESNTIPVKPASLKINQVKRNNRILKLN